jgi:hypothetical protein
MKSPSGTFIVIMLAMIGIVSVVIFQACATQSERGRDDNTFFLKIGKDEDTFVEFKTNPTEGKDRFDAVLRKLPKKSQYSIRYKKDDSPTTLVVEDYSPPPKPDVSLKTDNVTTAALAKNEPIGDPSVTRRVQSNDVADIQNVLNSLKK